MKIKLSKSQWNFIGKKAGWVKSSQFAQVEDPVIEKETPIVPQKRYMEEHLDLYNLESGSVNVSVDRYPYSRFWQVTLNGKLLAVVVYKKGAMAIKDIIEKLTKKGAL